MKLNDSDSEILDCLLGAMLDGQRSRANQLLTNPRLGGRGLRDWLTLLDAGGPSLPSVLPRELVEVYLTDCEAEPLHDCALCGLAVPVRAVRRCGHEAAVDRIYFPKCPHCGGRTGRYPFRTGHSCRTADTN